MVAAGGALLAPDITRRVIAEFARQGQRSLPPPAALSPLTDREKEVLAHVAQGLSNAEIAQALNMGKGTAKTHVSRLLTKLSARDRTQLVVIAYQAGVAAKHGA